jgi:hypothetical protein
MASAFSPSRQPEHRYTMAELINLRRQMLRFARSLPRGPERNERRQIASSLRRLFRNRAFASDVGSAKAIAQAGAKAIATSS